MRMSVFRRLAAVAALLVVSLATAPVAARPASAADFTGLRAWVGKYPSDKVGRYSFFAYPGLAAAMKRAMGARAYAGVMGIVGPEVPVIEVDGYVVANRCQAHDCGDKNMSVAVHIARGRVLVCWQNAPSRSSARWYEAGHRLRVDTAYGCPGDVREAHAAFRRLGY